MRFGLIIFDCDGVLVDSEVVACRVVARELGRLGFAISAEEVARRFVGRSTQDMLTTLAREQRLAIPDGFCDELLAAELNDFADELLPVPHVAATLKHINTPFCVASSSDVARIEESLRLTGLLDFFRSRIFSAQMVDRPKPFPDLFELAARSLEMPPTYCLVVEDSTVGVEAALAAGMTVFGFTGASHCDDDRAAHLKSAGATVVFDDMARLPALIEAIQ